MFLVLLLFIAALALEGIGTYISVIGLSAAFAADPIILTMAVVLDFCKIIAVSTLAKRWAQLNAAIKTYLVASVIVLMVITSSGIAGYLSNSFQKAMLPNQGNTIVLDNLNKEHDRLAARKKEIDAQVAQLPANNVRGRQKLMAGFKPETDHINTRLNEIDVELPKLQTQEVKQNTEVGPIIFLAKLFDMTPEKAVSLVIAMIIFVFDPLSIVFLTTGNRLLNFREDEKKKKKDEPKIIDEEKTVNVEYGTPIDTGPPMDVSSKKEFIDNKESILNAGGTVTPNYSPAYNPFDSERPNYSVKPSFGSGQTSVVQPLAIEAPKEEPNFVLVEPEVVEETPAVEVPFEEVKEEPLHLDDVLKKILRNADGKLTEEERQELDKALDSIFASEPEKTPSEPEEVHVDETILEEPTIPEAILVAPTDDTDVSVDDDLEIQHVRPPIEEPTPQIDSEEALHDLMFNEISTVDFTAPVQEVYRKSLLEDPDLDRINVSTEFLGKHWINPQLLEIYADKK